MQRTDSSAHHLYVESHCHMVKATFWDCYQIRQVVRVRWKLNGLHVTLQLHNISNVACVDVASW